MKDRHHRVFCALSTPALLTLGNNFSWQPWAQFWGIVWYPYSKYRKIVICESCFSFFFPCTIGGLKIAWQFIKEKAIMTNFTFCIDNISAKWNVWYAFSFLSRSSFFVIFISASDVLYLNGNILTGVKICHSKMTSWAAFSKKQIILMANSIRWLQSCPVHLRKLLCC